MLEWSDNEKGIVFDVNMHENPVLQVVTKTVTYAT